MKRLNSSQPMDQAIGNQHPILKRTQSLMRAGQASDAIATLDSWCKQQPASKLIPKAVLNTLAELQLQQEDYAGAIRSYAQLEQQRGKPTRKRIQELFTAAASTAQVNRNQESLKLHCQLLAADPAHTIGLRNGAIVLRRLKAFKAAEEWIMRYLELRPGCKHGLNTYGTILTDLGRHRDAITAFQAVLDQDPDYADANSNLANEYHLLAQIDSAYYYSSRAVAVAPERLDLLTDHLTQLRRVCGFKELEEVDWWTLLRKIPRESVSSIFLQALVLAEKPGDQQRLLQLVNDWGNHQAGLAQRHQEPLSPRLPIDPGEPLHIGFLSADFRDHSVARFIWPLFEHLDRNRFRLYGYSTYRVNDSWRQRFEQSADAIRDVGHCSPLELQRVIKSDRVHVLFDLTGFTRGSRTALLAWRCAPIQVSWLGYPGSSGLPQMDYLYLDQHLAPNEPKLIREKALISKGSTVCFSEIPEIPITPIIPELKRGFLTLGTLNNSYKITRSTLHRWARVMLRLPTSQFLFVRREFESYHLRENIKSEFERLGVEASRIHFFNNAKAGRHYLDCYNEIDITLDTFPVTGGTTTTDALWMGVPVVGLKGTNVHQRVCSAILHHAGHPEWIATNDDQFVDIALELAKDQPARIRLRNFLREELRSSKLCDTKQFAADFADAMLRLRTRQHEPG